MIVQSIAVCLLFHSLVLAETKRFDYTVIAKTGQLVPGLSNLIGLDERPAVDANGVVAFVGRFAGGDSVVRGDGSSPLIVVSASKMSSTERSTLFPNMLSVAGRIVTKSGDAAADPIRLYSADRATYVTIADSSDFLEIGRFPGISEDGQVVAFYGSVNVRGAAKYGPGKGIFASVAALDDDGNPIRRIQRLAGTSSGGFVDFADGPVGVSATLEVSRGVSIVYRADDPAGPGLYTSRLALISGNELPQEFAVGAAVPVIRIGDSVKGLSGAIQEFKIGNRPSRSDSGDIALWVSTSASEQAVLRARPQLPDVADVSTAVTSLDRSFVVAKNASPGQLAPQAAAVLSITKTHTGNFALGQHGATYTITVSNAAGAGATVGVVTVTDTVPAGLSLTQMGGVGWACFGFSCTRNDVLAPGSSYEPITALVNVTAVTPTVVTNSVTVSGGGSANASANDPTGLGNQAPTVTSLNPIASSGASQSFTFQFSDTDGFADLSVLNVLINNVLDGRQACYVAYAVSSNSLFLVNDGGDAGGPYAGGFVVTGGAGTASNSQCTINSLGSSAVSAGNNITLTLNITFTAAFGGNKVIYMAARDLAANNSGWQTMGVRGVPPLPSTFPNPVSVTPASGSTANPTLTFAFADAAAATNLQTGWGLINTAIDGRNACYIAYYRPGNQVFLYPDNGDGNQATSMILTGANTVSNSQCTVSAQGSTVSTNGAQLTVSLNVSFKPAFAGRKGVWMAIQTMGGAQTSAWQALGAWRVP